MSLQITELNKIVLRFQKAVEIYEKSCRKKSPGKVGEARLASFKTLLATPFKSSHDCLHQIYAFYDHKNQTYSSRLVKEMGQAFFEIFGINVSNANMFNPHAGSAAFHAANEILQQEMQILGQNIELDNSVSQKTEKTEEPKERSSLP